jgi:hypothetical protein
VLGPAAGEAAQAGREAEAAALLERALADCERVLGADHHLTWTVRERLAAARRSR